MQKYCHNCGRQVAVGAKFCNECGTNLSSLANVPEQPKQTVKARSSQFAAFSPGAEDDDGESYLDKLESAPVRQTELHLEVIKDAPLGESFGAIINQSQMGMRPSDEPPRPVPVNGNFLEEFRKEAGTYRAKS